jgi:ParB-like chromosome segregation protein Spo0J
MIEGVPHAGSSPINRSILSQIVWQSLLELGEPAYTITTIASRAGKSEAYVYGRIRLADLIPPVAEAFLKDQITIGHALLIAKLPASEQQEAFSAALVVPQLCWFR